jgi:hypothetical protein
MVAVVLMRGGAMRPGIPGSAYLCRWALHHHEMPDAVDQPSQAPLAAAVGDTATHADATLPQIKPAG